MPCRRLTVITARGYQEMVGVLSRTPRRCAAIEEEQVPESVQERVLIRCKVSLGLFAEERGVRVELPNGEVISALVDKSQVQIEREPAPGEEVDGFVWASIVDATGGSIVVDLPQQTLTGGTRMSVPRALLRTAA